MIDKDILRDLLNNYDELADNNLIGAYARIYSLDKEDMQLHLSTLNDALLDLGFTGEKIIKNYGQNYVPIYFFYKSENLKEVTIPKVREVCSASFYECPNLERVIIREGCESINSSVFHGCKKLRDVWLPSTIKFIGKDAFSECGPATFHINMTAEEWTENINAQPSSFNQDYTHNFDFKD